MNETSLNSQQPEQSGESVIQMQGVHKWFGQFHVLKDINLNVTQGEPLRSVRLRQVHYHSLPQPAGRAPAGSYRHQWR